MVGAKVGVLGLLTSNIKHARVAHLHASFAAEVMTICWHPHQIAHDVRVHSLLAMLAGVGNFGVFQLTGLVRRHHRLLARIALHHPSRACGAPSARKAFVAMRHATTKLLRHATTKGEPFFHEKHEGRTYQEPLSRRANLFLIKNTKGEPRGSTKGAKGEPPVRRANHPWAATASMPAACPSRLFS